MDERTRMVSVTAGMANAMGRTRMSDRACMECGMGFPVYPGRYPMKCPRCGGGVSRKEAGGTVGSVPFDIAPSESVAPEPLPVVLASALPRLQGLIDEGEPGDYPAATCSRARVVAYASVEERLSSLDGLRMFLEGPAQTSPPRYYRMEGIDDPVIVVEFRDATRQVVIFSTLDPVTYLGWDPRGDLVAEAVADEAKLLDVPYPIWVEWLVKDDNDITHFPVWMREHHPEIPLTEDKWADATFSSGFHPGGPIVPRDTSVIVEKPDGAGGKINGRAKDPGTAATRPVGGFRFEIGYRKRRHPRKNVELAIQNRLNARRGLASRIKAAKAWHRSHAGRQMHRDLGRYNSSRSESFWKVILPWALNEDNFAPDDRTIDDIFDSLLRRLISIESTDVLQDVEFEDNGAIYLFFDPTLQMKEMEEIIEALHLEADNLALIASPDRSLPGETVESDWWVVYVPPAAGRQPAEPDPNKYAAVKPPAGATAPKATMAVMAPPTSVDQIALSIDIDKLIAAVGKAQPAGEKGGEDSFSQEKEPEGQHDADELLAHAKKLNAAPPPGAPPPPPAESRVLPLWVPRGGREFHVRGLDEVFPLLERALGGKGKLFLIRECSYDGAVETVNRGGLSRHGDNVYTNLNDLRGFLGMLRKGGR
jgi:hypothetical protein